MTVVVVTVHGPKTPAIELGEISGIGWFLPVAKDRKRPIVVSHPRRYSRRNAPSGADNNEMKCIFDRLRGWAGKLKR